LWHYDGDSFKPWVEQDSEQKTNNQASRKEITTHTYFVLNVNG